MADTLQLGDSVYAITQKSGAPESEQQFLIGSVPEQATAPANGEKCVMIFSTAALAEKFVADYGNPDCAVFETQDPLFLGRMLKQLLADGVRWIAFDKDAAKGVALYVTVEEFARQTSVKNTQR